MVHYDVERKRALVSNAYDNLIVKIESLLKISRQNNCPTTTIASTYHKLVRLRKLIANNGERKTVEYQNEAVRRLVKRVNDTFAIDITEMYELELTSNTLMRNALIKYEYHQLAKQGIKYKEIKDVLAKKYTTTVSVIEKIIYKK